MWRRRAWRLALGASRTAGRCGATPCTLPPSVATATVATTVTIPATTAGTTITYISITPLPPPPLTTSTTLTFPSLRRISQRTLRNGWGRTDIPGSVGRDIPASNSFESDILLVTDCQVEGGREVELEWGECM